jgi:hypothetical protein
MRGARSWLRLVAGAGGLLLLVYVLAAVVPAPPVVAEAEERGIDVVAHFWTEVEDLEGR